MAIAQSGQAGGIQPGVSALQTTIGYTPPATIDGAVSSAAQTTFAAAGTGAVARTAQDKLRELEISVTDFGAVPGSSSDQSPAIQAAIEAYRAVDPAGTNGCRLVLPPGVYNTYTPLVLHRSLTIAGRGQSMATINVRGQVVWDTSMFAVSVTNVAFEDLQFTYAEPLTGSAPLIDFTTSGATLTIRRCGFQDCRSTLIRTAGNLRVDDIEANFGGFFASPTGTAFIEVVNNGRLSGRTIKANRSQAVAQAVTALRIRGTQGVYVMDFNPSNLERAVAVVPQSGETAFDVQIIGLNTDAMSGRAVDINPASGGTVRRVRLVEPAISTAGGEGIYAGGAGSVRIVRAVSPLVTGCTGSGVLVEKATDFVLSAPLIWGNGGDGVTIGGAGAVTGWSINGGKIGAIGGFSGNTGYGLNLTADAHNFFAVMGTDLRGNTAGDLNDLSTGSTKTLMPVLSANTAARLPANGTANVLLDTSGTGAQGSLEIASFAPGIVLRDKSGGTVNNRMLWDSPTWRVAWDPAADASYSMLGLTVRYTASAVNYVAITPTVTGSPATIAAAGDTNASLRLGAAGTGWVEMGPPMRLARYAFASLPSASTYNGCCLVITDRASRQAYSDGTNWRFVSGDAIVS